jgi:hypothetical protein
MMIRGRRWIVIIWNILRMLKYMLHVGTVKSMQIRRGKKRTK